MDATMPVVTTKDDTPSMAESGDFVASAEVRQLLTGFVRGRVAAADVDDVVQTVLCAAVASDSRPSEREELRRWVIGVARHKIADVHRKTGRSREVGLPETLPASLHADPPADDAHDLARWAVKQTRDDLEAKRTMDWMAREGTGEKLAHIAQQEKLPAAQVRQRVSRLRRSLKQRWLRELAAVAAVGVLVLVAWRLLRPPETAVVPRPDPDRTARVLDPRIERGRKLRAEALVSCDAEAWQLCLDKLDRAAELDPVANAQAEVAAARARARQALDEPPPLSPPAPTVVPTSKPLAPPVNPAPRPIEQKGKQAPRNGYPKKRPPQETKKRPIQGKQIFAPQYQEQL
jgi:DNA-directed RNA polymerase specialized sigma24 family protein